MRLRVAGRSASSAGSRMCALITDLVPAAIAARNGSRSRACTVSRSTSIRGTAWWESTAVSPCPGKCLTQAATPALCRPVTNAAVCRATSSGSAPKDRTPMTGLCRLELTSADGAQSRVTPHAASRLPSSSATARVRSRSSTAPRAWLPGKEEPCRTSRRVTSPPSSSMATRTSSRSARSRSVSAASCSGEATLRPKRPTEASPSSMRRSSQSGAVVPRKPGWRTARASRVRVSALRTSVDMSPIPSLHRRSGR